MFSAVVVEATAVVTMTPSFQMAKFQPPVVKIMSLKKGDRCTVFTNQLWILKQWRGLAPERGDRKRRCTVIFDI